VHRALLHSRLIKDVFLAMLRRSSTLKPISKVVRESRPVMFADTSVCAIEPPSGFEALATAMTEPCAITIAYEHGWQRPKLRKITPRLVLEIHGVAYVIAHCHLSHAERTFRLDRIREWWLASETRESW
jgi:predicted DNA-binding transcriptional regulator YafY